MINAIVFSKDRASQLDLFIRSLKKYFVEFEELNFKILYTYSNDSFKQGYDKLFDIHDELNITWIKEEKRFKEHLIEFINEEEKYTIFFVDDMIFKNEFSLNSKQFKLFTLDDTILTLSLRLHKNLSYCYPARIHISPPTFDVNNTFRWRGQQGDYGYPMSLDGNFFRTKDILPFLKSLNYNNPNSLESQLAVYPLNRQKMICFDESVVLTIPVNKVQNFNQNIYGNISSKFLNDKFLDGYIVDLEPYNGFKNVSCHQEMDMEYIKIK